MFSAKWAAGVLTSAILVMIVIYGIKKFQVPVLSNIANEI